MAKLITRAEILTDALNKQRAEIRRAVADYMQSEGCECCSNREKHAADKEPLGQLLKARKYKDKSGYDFSSYRTEGKR